MHCDHQKEAEGVEPESGPVSSLSSRGIQIIDSSEVLSGEEPHSGTGTCHWLGYKEESVKDRDQVCGQHKPERVDIPKINDKTSLKYYKFFFNVF